MLTALAVAPALSAQEFYAPTEFPELYSDVEPWLNPRNSFEARLTYWMTKNPSFLRIVEIDTLSGDFILSQRYLRHDLTIPYIVDMETHAMAVVRQSTRALLHLEIQQVVNDEFASSRTGQRGLGFSVPFPVQSETFQKVFGGTGVELNVNGQVNLQASATQQSEDAVKTALNRGSNLQFNLEQQQRFNIEGKVGEKVSIRVDQDSERDFDFDNNIRINYTGEDDEIIESLQAGNIALSLPGTQFVTFSGSNQGLFGLRSDMKIGNVDITTIASLEKGEKKKISIQGGSETNAQKIADWNYIKNVYFFLDEDYRDNYGLNSDGLLRAAPQNLWIQEITVWEAAPGYNLRDDSRQGWALADPNNFERAEQGTGLDFKSSPNQRQGFFRLLMEGQDYTAFKELGYIVMTQPVRDKILAVGYLIRGADAEGNSQFGMVRPPTSNDEVFVLKLIRNDNPRPADLTWDLAWKHVYSLGQRNIPPEGLEVQIVNTKDATRPTIHTDGKTYIEHFGLDNASEDRRPIPDNRADTWNVNIFNLARGELIFPTVRPFDTQAPQDFATPEIYDTLFTNSSDWTRVSKFDIEIKSSAAAASYNLGFNTLPGSEEVYLDGRQLQKGIDYEIDYTFGQLTIKNEDALRPGANLDIRYESGQLFQLDKKTLIGARAEYELPFGNNSFVGGTLIKLSESILESRVRVGQEPVSNAVWDLNTRIQLEPQLITELLNRLPLIATDAPSVLRFEAEIGQVLPNPNTIVAKSTGDPLGVAFIDDFEGAKRENLISIARRAWVRSSVPLTPIGRMLPEDNNAGVLTALLDASQENRGKMIWYNPWEQVNIKDIFPEKDVNSRTGLQQNVLTLERRFDPNYHPTPISTKLWWGGVTTFLPVSMQNQSDTKFIEIMAQGTQGIIHFDIGLISEDINGDGQYQTEDFAGAEIFENGIIDEGEDIGVDLIDAPDGPANTGETYDDDWRYSNRSNVYLNINGTEENGSGDIIDGLRIPDSEDLNRNGTLDTQNEYFSYAINLDPTSAVYQKFIAGGTEGARNDSGEDVDLKWRLFRIPIRDFAYKVGNPDLTRLEYARIWVEDLPLPPAASEAAYDKNAWGAQQVRRRLGQETHLLSIASIAMVSSDWKEQTEIVAFDSNDIQQDAANFVAATVVNNEENPLYRPPPGVRGVEDRITGVELREQSLVLRFDALPPGNAVAIKKSLLEITDIIHYEQLKMFVHGDETGSIVVTNDSVSNVEFFMRIGRDENNFYEVRGFLFPGWDVVSKEFENAQGRNEIILPVNRLATLPQDQLVTPDWGGGKRYRRVGTPTIRQLQIMTLGIINRGETFISGDVWFDELRVSKVERVRGKAVRAKLEVQLADIGMISTDIVSKDADFHTVNEHFGTGSNTLTQNLSAQLNLSRMLSSEPSWNIPLTFSSNSSTSRPKYLTGTDILFELAQGDSLTSKANIQDRNTTRSSSNSLSFSIGKARPSRNWLLKNTVDKINYNFSRTQSQSSNFNTAKNQNVGFSHGLGWSVAFPRKTIQPFTLLGENTWFLGNLAKMKLGYLPNNFSFNSGLTESTTTNHIRGGKKITQSTSSMTRTMSTGLQLLPSLTVNMSRGFNNDLTDTTRTRSALYDVLTGNLGRLTTMNQSFTGNFQPRILPFITNSFSYNSSFNLNNNINLPTAGKSATNNTTLSSRFQLDISRMLGITRTSGRGRGRASIGRRPTTGTVVGPGGRRRPTRPQDQQEEAEEGGGEFFLFSMTKGLINRLNPISLSVSNSRQVQNVGLKTAPGFLYQIGLAEVDTLNTIGIGSSVGTQQNSMATRKNIGLSTGFRLIASMRLTVKYDVSTSDNERGTTRTGNRSESYMILGGKRIPMINWQYNWTGLERMYLLRRVFNTLSVDHAYTGKKTQDLRTRFERGSEIGIFEPTTENFTSGFSPLVRINFNIKGGLTGGFGLTENETIGKDLLVGTENRSLQSNMTLNAAFNKSNFNLPIPFMGNKKLNNNINFNLSFDKTSNTTFRQNVKTGAFVESGAISRWNLRQEVGYQLSSKVQGSLYFQLGQSKSKLQGTTSMKDFGFSINIRIEGTGT